MCFKSRRHGEREQVLATRRHVWWLGRRRCDVEGRGEASGGRASGGRGCWRARGVERSGAGAAGAREMVDEGGGVTGVSRAGGGLEVEDRDLSAIFQKMQGLHYKVKLTFKP
jgi:hypothetical protein